MSIYIYMKAVRFRIILIGYFQDREVRVEYGTSQAQMRHIKDNYYAIYLTAR